METRCRKNLAFISLILIYMVRTTVSRFPVDTHSCSNTGGNYTKNSIYDQNLQTLLYSIASNTRIDYGFYNFSAGQEPDKVNAIALCLGDLTEEQCRSCLANSTRRIVEDCPNQKEAIGWYTDCMIRYSNASIFGIGNSIVLQPVFIAGWNASDIEGHTQALGVLLQRLRNEAASGDSRRKFAVGVIPGPNLDTISGLLQCTPDLTFVDCETCLMKAAGRVPTGSVGTRIYLTSCYLRYETNDLFYNVMTPPPIPLLQLPPSPTPDVENDGRKSTTVIVIVTVAILSAILLVLAIFITFRWRNINHKNTSQNFEDVALGETTDDEISSIKTVQFDLDIIRVATNDFSSENKLGQGGFGAVYKGKLANGQCIAVKRLAINSQQGDGEFKNEVLLVVKLQHRNLVRLLGFCIQNKERLLIYEFVPNASLDQFIFENSNDLDSGKKSLLDWKRRWKIINGVARGLLYLHEDSRLRIIHRDLKVSNILLDEEMNPKIADFGMARLFELDDQTQGNTNRIVGTYGYMAPEYLMHGKFSVKSDVFSFGVLVLELVSGKRNRCFRNGEHIEDLSSFAWKNWKAGTTKNVIDPILRDGSNVEMLRCIHIGLLCVQENTIDRPTMANVVLMLSSLSLTLPIPLKPGFFMHSSIEDEASRSRTIPLQYLSNEACTSELHPR